MPQVSLNGSIKISLGILAFAATTFAQTDPGVRAGAAGAGGQMAGLTSKEGQFFSTGQDAFQEVASVLGTIPDTERGLGPRFNLDSCAGCHKFPSVGGSSPKVNPQVTVAPISQVAPLQSLNIINLNGPIREVRFASDGGVHDLFTIMGRIDTPAGCSISQPDFAGHAADLRFRIPTPVFGAGLIEAISDSTIAANQAATKPFGITGHANRSGNDGTITRFGWKAQNKSLIIFAGEAYNVEQGVTNELFPDERGEGGVQDPMACRTVPAGQDHTNYDYNHGSPQHVPGDAVAFANFMRFLAPPAPVSSYTGVTSASISNGAAKFASVGCAVCHTPSMPTGNHDTAAMANQTANLYSDLLVHGMGTLGDGISQGNANGNEFRTAPLWGVGQRVFFLHDGRTSDLLAAILAHSSKNSEAKTVIDNFNGLSVSDKQDILNFLRSL